MEQKDIIEATCPECRGPLTKIGLDHVHEYQCLVGHKYSPEVLLRAHSETQERVLWAAVVALEETKAIVDAVSDDFPPDVIKRLEAQVERKREQAGAIRRVLENLEMFQIDPPEL